MKSTVIIFALAIVLLAVIANHGCESALKMAAEDRQNVQQTIRNACTTFKSVCDRLLRTPIVKRLPRVKRICGLRSTFCDDIPELVQIIQG